MDLNATEFEALRPELGQALWKSQELRQQHSYTRVPGCLLCYRCGLENGRVFLLSPLSSKVYCSNPKLQGLINYPEPCETTSL